MKIGSFHNGSVHVISHKEVILNLVA